MKMPNAIGKSIATLPWCWLLGITAGIANAAFPPVALQPVVQNQLVSPVGITSAPFDSARMFVTDQLGTVHVVQNGALQPNPFLDLSSQVVPLSTTYDERGLLGFALHPNYGHPQQAPGYNKVYAYYSAPHPNANPGDPVNPIDHQSILKEFTVTEQGGTAIVLSDRVVMSFDQPQSNHNGGWIGFGPDNMLYISSGDGGGSFDNYPGHTGGGNGLPPISGGLGNAQDRTKLLGKMLRIDVDGQNGPGGTYGIPADNPFVGEGGGVREEIFAYGLRNVWRASFDDGPGGTGRLFAGDVGQNSFEEVNIIHSGGNYGWRIKEGTFDFDNTVSPNPVVPLVDPIAQYTRTHLNNGLPQFGVAVTGGEVYRGSQFPELQGKYIFGDWSRVFTNGDPQGMLLGLEEIQPGSFELSALQVVGGNPIGEYVMAFGTDQVGEIYVATKRTLGPNLDPQGFATGSIYRIVAVPEPASGLLGIGLASLVLRHRRKPRRFLTQC